MTFIVIFFFAALVIAGVAVVLNMLYEKMVEKRLKEYGQEHNAKFLIHMDNTLRPFLANTKLTSGSSWAKFVMNHRVGGNSITTAVWFNKISTGKSSHTYSYQIAIMPVTFRSGGQILMRKEHIGDKMKLVLGMNDLDFEHAEFSNRYYITADPEKFGYDFFHPRMIEVFLHNREYYLLVRSDHLILYRSVPVRRGITALPGLIGRKCPQIAWMEEAMGVLIMVRKAVPKRMVIGDGR